VNLSSDASPSVPVSRIEIPNPFFEGTTNVYLLETEPLTLIDTGIGTEEALAALKAGFDAVGRRLEDLERIVLTHKHQDHFGLAHVLQDLTHCEVFIHHEDHADVARVSERLKEYEAIVRQRMHDWGVPDEDTDRVASMPHRLDKLCGSVEAQPLEHGQQLQCGETRIAVIHTPGHTVGSICLELENHLFTGDHVLPDYTPNIGGGDIENNGLLVRYLNSLKTIATYDRPGLIVLPGHDNPVTNLSGQVTETIQHHAQREAEMLRLLQDGPPRTIYEIACKMFGVMRDYHLVLGTGEAHAHLELMVEKGLITQEAGRFQAVR